MKIEFNNDGKADNYTYAAIGAVAALLLALIIPASAILILGVIAVLAIVWGGKVADIIRSASANKRSREEDTDNK